ncbi:hypothetical protein [[Ruminococcus] torques]|uniref:hypothetical protein n=1 Tax=[Ruminococcus] torques TaxID=33039 RepID=UPI003AB4B5EF
MNIGLACAIFQNINSEKYTENEKLEAIKKVLEMPTHNGTTKGEIISTFRWFWNWSIEEAEKETAERAAAEAAQEAAEGVLMYGA